MEISKLSQVDYGGWDAVQITTDAARLTVPTSIGLRIIEFGFRDGPNLFYNDADQIGGSGESEFMLRGGHRFWVAPEELTRTPELDNAAIAYEAIPGGVRITQPIDPKNQTLKEIEISFIDSTSVRVLHKLTNRSVWPIEMAPWALSVMSMGGYLALPLPEKRDHGAGSLLPNKAIVLWPYTDFSVPQWQFHQTHIGVDTCGNRSVQKLGVRDYPAWSAYWQPGGTFLKAQVPTRNGDYPDEGCVFETYFCPDFIEIETLGVFGMVQPGETVEHVENWGLVGDLPRPDSVDVFNESLKPAAMDFLAGVL